MLVEFKSGSIDSRDLLYLIRGYQVEICSVTTLQNGETSWIIELPASFLADTKGALTYRMVDDEPIYSIDCRIDLINTDIS